MLNYEIMIYAQTMANQKKYMFYVCLGKHYCHPHGFLCKNAQNPQYAA